MFRKGVSVAGVVLTRLGRCGYWSILAAVLLACGGPMTAPAFAQVEPSIPLFGGEVFTRLGGKPNAITRRFELPPEASPPYEIIVFNGETDGSDRVSSAQILLNRVPVAVPNDFNQTVGVV